MAHPIMSKKRSRTLSFALFLIGIAILIFFDDWWPGIMLVIGLPLALREYLQGRRYDALVTLIVFVGVYVTVEFQIAWKILLPILFTIGGIFIFFRELFSLPTSEEEEEEDIAKELEEEKKDQ